MKRWSRTLTVAEYVAGLTAVAPRMNADQRRLLAAHYYAPGRQVTVPQLALLAEVAGGYRKVNALYGRLGRLFCNQTGERPDVRPVGRNRGKERLWSTWSTGWQGPDGYVWQMLPEVAVALEQLGWVTPRESSAVSPIASQVSAVEVSERPVSTARESEAEFSEASQRRQPEDRRYLEEDAGRSEYDWKTDVREWCQRQSVIQHSLTENIISFFQLSFYHTSCPEKSWFGCHSAGVSLVVGGMYLAAIQLNGDDRGLWLVVDQAPPTIGGINYRPVRSTLDSQHPLVWAHADSLEVISDILALSSLWHSFRSATAKVLSSSSSASDRDGVQKRRQKRRLTDFWPVDRQPLKAEEADQSGYTDKAGYNPDGNDRRRLVERQIRERRGQGEFRNTLRQRYGDRCLVTGSNVLAVLEAAHINPYRGEQDNHPENGLLLRSDIHTLFDLDLLGIEPEKLLIEFSPEVCDEYGHFAGKVLDVPADCRPSLNALRSRYQQFRENLGVKRKV